MPRIRVLYFIGRLELGGAERQLTELVLGLDRARFEPVVCCLSGAGPLASVLRSAGVPVRNMGVQRARIRRYPWKVVGDVSRVIRLVRTVHPDVIHGYLYWAYVAGALVGKVAGVPVIIAGRRSLGNFKAGNSALLAIERVANSFTDLLIANSSAVRSDVLLQEGVAAEKVVVIRNGLDLARYQLVPDISIRKDLRLAPEAPVVTVVANFIQYKGHRYLLEAWTRVVEAVPGSVALLVGDGPLRPELERLARDLGIEDSIRFLGSRMDVPKLLATSDVLAHPSLEEGFCNAILEAMAAGKAVVATSVGGNPEAVVDGLTGILVPPRDAESLAQALVGVLKDPDKARKMGVEGRARVEREFGLRPMVESYEQAYLDLLRRKKVRVEPR